MRIEAEEKAAKTELGDPLITLRLIADKSPVVALEMAAEYEIDLKLTKKAAGGLRQIPSKDCNRVHRRATQQGGCNISQCHFSQHGKPPGDEIVVLVRGSEVKPDRLRQNLS